MLSCLRRGTGKEHVSMEPLRLLQEILSEYTDAAVTPSASLIEDLGLDSFLIVYFLTQAEERLGFQIDESEFETIVTIGDVLAEKAKQS